ncbi:MAG TPA: aspartate aminotransferase family protein [Actinomycetota bacterium]|nr:aspartate aminotransferase family protein [Actinomycetota bacterium]
MVQRTESAPASADRDLDRLDRLIEEQERAFLSRQRRSAELLERARRVLAGGVTSSWQIARPQAVWLNRGRGSRVWDADGNEYVDFHGGYGVNLAGHGHPAIVRAVTGRAPTGTHFAQPTEDAIVVAEELTRRFGLPVWRFNNSGTEATMDAVHLMRAATGRDRIVKVEGSYHGHHDSVMVSVYNDVEELGSPHRPDSPASGAGLPRAILELVTVVPYNDLAALERILDEHAGEVAGMIVEPVMMNAGIILPDDGYLAGVRDLVHARGALLAFDEVKTGFTAGPGGGTAAFGVSPDLVCLAKALGGGVPCGAIGGTEAVMGLIADGRYEQVGTFNGNPLTMAAARAQLLEVLDEEAYRRLGRLRDRIVRGAKRIIGAFDLPAHVVAVGAKGCITFSPSPVRNYRAFLAIDDRWSHAHWLFQMAGGVFLPPWGKAEQWLLSVQHAETDIDRFLDNFETFGRALRA